MPRSNALAGLALAAGVALPATWLGALVPVVGGPAFGIVVGAAVGCALRRWYPLLVERCRPGLAVAGKQVLQAGIVVLGLGLPLGHVLQVGGQAVPVMLGTLAVALGGAWVLGRLLRLHPETNTLIAVGTGICGASAIAAVSAVIQPAQERVAYAIGTIFTFNIVAVLAYPALGHLIGMSDQAFGLWVGTSVNDTSSVVAAAHAFGTAAAAYAVVVKLARSLMIVPICVGLQAWQVWRARGFDAVAPARPAWRSVPVFIVGFLAASLLASYGVVPAEWQPSLSELVKLVITVALAGVGLALNIGDVRSAGPRPLLFGGLLGAAVGATSLGLQALTGQL